MNRSFKDSTAAPAHWALIPGSATDSAISLDETQPIAGTALTTSVRVNTGSGGLRSGVANDGFLGIPVKPHAAYRFAFFAKGDVGFTGPISVSIESPDGAVVYTRAQLAPFVQDALDEIEYIRGGTDTVWGARRAADGYPDPFPLEYVEIGNEDFFDVSGSYNGRFAQFYDAIKAAHPDLKIIATTGVTSRTPDVIDEHFYTTPRSFQRMATRYDNFDRNGPKIFVGEYAAIEGGLRPISTPHSATRHG